MLVIFFLFIILLNLRLYFINIERDGECRFFKCKSDKIRIRIMILNLKMCIYYRKDFV